MDTKRQRSVYVSHKQKKKLIELMAKHPELITCKVTEDFNYKDSERLWHNIAEECNAIPGAKKTWRQWRKSWQDIRCHVKKQQELTNGEIPVSVTMLTAAEQEALGLKNVTSTTNYQDPTEFVTSEGDNIQENFINDIVSTASISEPESQEEDKVFTRSQRKAKKLKSSNKTNLKHSNSCLFNCDMLAVQEQKKLQIKEDYYTFKKDYLRQKLLLIKEQTEALRSIAKELAK